jgi:hypothetical protein
MKYFGNNEETDKSSDIMSDKDGPGKGQSLSDLGSDCHLNAMAHHSKKYNDILNAKEHSSSDHVKTAAMAYHKKMYDAHKQAIS